MGWVERDTQVEKGEETIKGRGENEKRVQQSGGHCLTEDWLSVGSIIFRVSGSGCQTWGIERRRTQRRQRRSYGEIVLEVNETACGIRSLWLF